MGILFLQEKLGYLKKPYSGITKFVLKKDDLSWWFSCKKNMGWLYYLKKPYKGSKRYYKLIYHYSLKTNIQD